jgi:hypothetical protein
MATEGGPKLVSDGLVLALDAANNKSYPGSGITWSDLSGNGNSATLQNGPTFDNSNNGNIQFDGVNDWVSIPSTGITSWSSSFSMEIWFNIPSSAVWANNRLSSIFSVNGGYPGMYGLARWPTEGKAGLYVRGDNGRISTTVGGLSRDTWHHLIGTWDGNNSRLYYNGKLVSGPSGSPRTGIPDTSNLNLGLSRAFSGSTGAFFEGSMAKAKYYIKTLTPQEVLQNYNATKSRFNL